MYNAPLYLKRHWLKRQDTRWLREWRYEVATMLKVPNGFVALAPEEVAASHVWDSIRYDVRAKYGDAALYKVRFRRPRVDFFEVNNEREE